MQNAKDIPNRFGRNLGWCGALLSIIYLTAFIYSIIACLTDGVAQCTAGATLTFMGRNLGWWGALSNVCDGDGRGAHDESLDSEGVTNKDRVVTCMLKAGFGDVVATLETYPEGRVTNGVNVGYAQVGVNHS
jgi:hypothetical protein